jgi:hypothetical protein
VDISNVLRDLKSERERLTRAIDALEAINDIPQPKRPGRRPGRPGAQPAAQTQAPAKRGPRKMSAAGRKRISEMMKKRWAERRKAAK